MEIPSFIFPTIGSFLLEIFFSTTYSRLSLAAVRDEFKPSSGWRPWTSRQSFQVMDISPQKWNSGISNNA